MKIGELSRRAGVSVRMLRYYEVEGLLTPGRTSNGYRSYSKADERAVEVVKLLGAAGMTLETVKRFLPCLRSDEPTFEPCEDLRLVLSEQMALADARVESLARVQQALARLLSDMMDPPAA